MITRGEVILLSAVRLLVLLELVAGKLIVVNMAKHYCPAKFLLNQLLVNKNGLRAAKRKGS